MGVCCFWGCRPAIRRASLAIGGAEKDYDQRKRRDDPLVQRTFEDGLETSEGPELSRSVFPPGTTCTWHFADGTSHVMGPSWVPFWWATAGAAAAATGIALIARRPRHA